jgi:hypothetical protein
VNVRRKKDGCHMQILVFGIACRGGAELISPIIPPAKQFATILLTKITRLTTGLVRRKNEKISAMNWKAGISYTPHAHIDETARRSTIVKAPLKYTSTSTIDLSISLINRV